MVSELVTIEIGVLGHWLPHTLGTMAADLLTLKVNCYTTS